MMMLVGSWGDLGGGDLLTGFPDWCGSQAGCDLGGVRLLVLWLTMEG